MALSTDRFKETLYTMLNISLERHPEVLGEVIHHHRCNLSKLVSDFHKGAVAHGPFKGLKLQEGSHWSHADRGTMVLGLYEKEILEELQSLKGQYNTFIDLGAADGYYGLGVLVGGICNKSYCFEMNETGRKNIAASAKLNGVESRAVVRGTASKTFYKDIDAADLGSSILFVDIEGGEFDLLSAEVFAKFSQSVVFVELHDWFFSDGQRKKDNLRRSAEKTHSWREITMGSRDLSNFPEIATFNDTDRWLLCSEGRARLMTWVRLDPKI